MSNVLYEVSFNPDMGWLIEIAWPFVLLFCAAFAPYGYMLSGKKLNASAAKGISIFGVTFLSVIIIIVGCGHFNMVKNTVWAYNEGCYELVEGYVENFDPMPYEGHDFESFEIDGVKFFYSDYNVTVGYNKTKSHGGVISGNGQHLRIKYIYLDESYGNVIMYIEQLQE